MKQRILDKKSECFFFLWIFVILTAYSQEGDFLFEFSTISLKEDVVLRQSKQEGYDGFVWMASNKGLCRFDGQHFTFYQDSPENPCSILSDDVLEVLPLENEIWAGTVKGISVLNLHTNQFRNYSLNDHGQIERTEQGVEFQIYELYKDRQGFIWVGTRNDGLWQYYPKADTFKAVRPAYIPPLTPRVYPSNRVLSITQSRTNDSIIWAGTTSGLMEVNKYSGLVEFYNYSFEDKSYQAEANIFRRLYQHDDGLLYVGSWRTGVHVFDPEKKSFTPIKVTNDPEGILQKGTAFAFMPKSKDSFWVSMGSGVYLYSSTLKRILFEKPNNFRKDINYGIHMMDRRGRAWFSRDNQLFISDPHLQQFKVHSFVEEMGNDMTGMVFLQVYDADKDVIFFCPRRADGIYAFNRQDYSYEFYPYSNADAFGHDEKMINAHGFQRVSDNEFVISAEPGLYFYNIQTQRLRPVLDDPVLQEIRWMQLLIDSQGALWVSSRASGLYKFDLETKEYEVFREELILSDTLPSITENMFEDSRGNIWLKRSRGLSVLDRDQELFHNFLFSVNEENSFFSVDEFAEDQKGRVWISSYSSIGYGLVDQPEKGIVKKFNILEMGAESGVRSLRTDSKGRIWGFTNSEIFRLDEEGQIAYMFKLKFSGQAISFFGMEFLPDDQMVIGGRRELTLVNPYQLSKNKELPTPYLTEVSIKQDPIESRAYTFGSNPLHLKHNENFFSFAYAAQAFTLGDQVTFRYRLKGFEDWVDAEASTIAKYTNVPAGEYTFQLMAANNEGIWNEKILELPVIIDQAWYKSWGFFSLLGLLGLLLTYLFVQYRIGLVRKEEKLKATYEKKLAGVEMSALIAQMNPHFLFNSLNSIDSYIIKNESIKASEYLNNFARLMRLTLQKSRANFTSLKDEIEVLRLYLQMESMRFDELFSYEICVAPEINVDQIEIPPMLIQPFLENAIWHGLMHMEKEGGKEGKVKLHFELMEEKLKVTIEDNGIGRVASDVLKKNKTNTHKESMGMKITENRIEMINKLYNADASLVINDLYDQQGQAAGTKVILTIAI